MCGVSLKEFVVYDICREPRAKTEEAIRKSRNQLDLNKNLVQKPEELSFHEQKQAQEAVSKVENSQ